MQSKDPERSIVVRPINTDDLPVLLDMIHELAAYERLAHKVTATIDDLRTWLLGSETVAEAVIALHNAQPVGYAVYFRYFSTFRGQPGMYLEDIYVRETSRGLGVGEALLRRVAAIALERHCPRLEWIVLDWNDPAIGFYRRFLAEPESKDWTTYSVTGEALRRLAREMA